LSAKNLGIDEKLFRYMIETAEKTPFYRLLGIQLNAIGPGYAEATVTVREDHTNPLGLVHGGVLLSLGDSAMGNAIRSLGIMAVTADCTNSFMSAAPLNEKIVASGRVIKAGKNLIFAEARITAGEKLLGDTRGTFYKKSEVQL